MRANPVQLLNHLILMCKELFSAFAASYEDVRTEAIMHDSLLNNRMRRLSNQSKGLICFVSLRPTAIHTEVESEARLSVSLRPAPKERWLGERFQCLNTAVGIVHEDIMRSGR